MWDILKHSAPANASVGTATGEVLAANTNRRGAVFTNDSANKIWLGIGAAAVVNKGIFLAANGGYYEINDTNLTYQAVNAIADAASSNLCVQEADPNSTI